MKFLRHLLASMIGYTTNTIRRQKVSHYKLSFKGNKINVSIKYASGRRLRRMIMSYILHLIAFTPPMPYMNYTQIDLHHIITGKRDKETMMTERQKRIMLNNEEIILP